MSRSGVAWVRAGVRPATLMLPLLLIAGCSPRSPAPPTASRPPASAAGAGTSATPSSGEPASTATPLPYVYPTPPLPPPNAIETLTMLTAETGWAQRRLDGAVLHTTQGVQHWSVATPLLSDGQRIVAVAFVGAGSARVLTAGGLSSNADAAPVSMTFTSWATDDGGARWSRGGSLSVVQDPGLSWQGALDFVNPADGWFSANQDDIDASLGTTLFRTVDGGAHWDEVAHLEPTSSRGSTTCYAQPTATFASPTTGWLSGGGCAAAQFEVTHNGGVTWSPQPIPLLSTPYLGLESPTFITSQDGVMLGTPASEEPGVVVYLTLDGGRSWTAHDAPGTSPHAVDVINADDIWLLSSDTMNAGFAAGLYVTHDGGQIWSTLQRLDNGPPPGGLDFNGSILDFVSASLGWTDTFIGDGDDILQTTDGGHTWKRVTVQIKGSS